MRILALMSQDVPTLTPSSPPSPHAQQKREELKGAKERLENGVDKIAQASAQVADLQKNLKDEQIIVEEKKAQTDELIVSIGKEKAVVDEAVEASREVGVWGWSLGWACWQRRFGVNTE